MTTNRLLLGALAGIAGTFAMTAAARAMHRALPPPERYPLPPREIMEGALPAPAKRTLGEQGRRSATLAAHFGYGAATGALYALLRPRGIILPGAAYGLLVWTMSYFGIMPGLRILQPAHNHPLRRNWLMIVAHVVWGSTMATTLRVTQQEVLASRHRARSESLEVSRGSESAEVGSDDNRRSLQQTGSSTTRIAAMTETEPTILADWPGRCMPREPQNFRAVERPHPASGPSLVGMPGSRQQSHQ